MLRKLFILVPKAEYQIYRDHVLLRLPIFTNLVKVVRMRSHHHGPVNSYSLAGSSSVNDCTCMLGFEKENGAQEGFSCYCAAGRYLQTQGSCKECAVGQYQDETQKSSCKACPFLSLQRPLAVKNLTTASEGKYLNGTECVKCQICDPKSHPGHYKQVCEKESPGICAPCQACASPLQKLAGCSFLSGGVCRDVEELVRTPFCPVADTSNTPLAISARQASDLGPFTFEEVFRSDATDADFVCSTPCDGVLYDSIQCDGPFAYNVKTCAERTEAGQVPKACPVVTESNDDEQMREKKRADRCVSCRECGRLITDFDGGASKVKGIAIHLQNDDRVSAQRAEGHLYSLAER
jgi:hypothetical protein